MSKLFSLWIDDIKSVWFDLKKIPHFVHKLLFIWGVYLISYWSLIRSYMIFAADNKRVTGNTHPWITGGGRYLNDWLTPLVFASPDTQDVQPLPRIFALLILALTTLIFVYIVCKKTNYLRLFFATCLGLSPFFVQNISYNFDSIFMCASSFFAIIPFLFWKKNLGLFALVSTLCAFFWLGFYQSAISCYLMLIIYLSFLDFIHTKDKLSILLVRFFVGVFVVFVCSMVADLMLSYFLQSEGSYTQNHLPLCRSIRSCTQTTINNFYVFMNLLSQNFKKSVFQFFFILFALCFTVHAVFLAIHTQHRFSKIDNALIALLVSLGLFLSLFIYQALLLHPQFDQRTITSLGMIVALYLFDLQTIKIAYLRKSFSFCAVVLMWCLMIFVMTYGNLWAHQMKYDHYFIGRIKKIATLYPHFRISFPTNGFHINLIEKQDYIFRFLINCIIKNGEERRIPVYYNVSTCSDGDKHTKKQLYDEKLLSFTQISDDCIQAQYHNP